MTTVSSTSTTNLLSDYMQSSKSKTTTEAQQDRFLKLLVTQMQNQDPLNPMDNAQITSQMAQISTVTGIDKLNTTLASMTDSFSALRSLQATSLIGRGVLSEGKTLLLEGGKATGGVLLDQSASDVTVKIKTTAGVEVDTVSLDSQSAGLMTFAWDGKDNNGNPVTDGEYVFEVTATSGGKSVAAQTIGFGRVQSVTLDGGQLVLDTSGLGPLRMDQIKQILQ